MKKKIIGIIACMLLIITAIPTVGIMKDSINLKETSDDFDTKIENLMEQGHMPSLVCCVIKDNTTVFLKAYGDKEYYSEKETTNDTVYPIASITKSMTSTAIMQLNESGLIGLDDNVSKYLGFDLKNPDYPEVNITPRMLLAHDSSISDNIFGYTALFYIFKYPHKKI